MIHIRQAHQEPGMPGDLASQRAAIQAEVKKRNLPFPCVLDGLGGEAEVAFRAWPMRLVVLRPDGRVAYETFWSPAEPWDPDVFSAWLEAQLGPRTPGKANN